MFAISRRWAERTDAPLVFALVYGAPYFLLTFQDSHGDSIQMMDGIRSRYFMSEPGATWVHHWLYFFLHEPMNVGAKFAIGLSSRLAGLVYLWAVAKISWELFPQLEASRRLLFRLVYFTAGWALLFFGYVENTPLAIPAEMLWVLSSLIFLRSPSHSKATWCAAALALATAMHGRAAFLSPALPLLCLVPAGSFGARIKRALVGGLVYVGLLGAMVAYIVLIDFGAIGGGVYGNVFGGGNHRMFVVPELVFRPDHWQPLMFELLIAGGFLGPVALLAIPLSLYWRDRMFVWAMGYFLVDMVFVFLWEFDYGTFGDWDLIFSAVGPILLLAAIVVVRCRTPLLLALPFLVGTVVLTMAFAAIVNGAPLQWNVVPRAGQPTADPRCVDAGLRRTLFVDPDLRNPKGPSDSALPFHVYRQGSGERTGGIYEGYIKIREAGRYRFKIVGQGSLRFRLADQLLYERWTGLDWQITSEREMKFTQPGWFPIRLEFSSTAPSIAIELRVESAQGGMRPLNLEELCHS